MRLVKRSHEITLGNVVWTIDFQAMAEFDPGEKPSADCPGSAPGYDVTLDSITLVTRTRNGETLYDESGPGIDMEAFATDWLDYHWEYISQLISDDILSEVRG